MKIAKTLFERAKKLLADKKTVEAATTWELIEVFLTRQELELFMRTQEGYFDLDFAIKKAKSFIWRPYGIYCESEGESFYEPANWWERSIYALGLYCEHMKNKALAGK